MRVYTDSFPPSLLSLLCSFFCKMAMAYDYFWTARLLVSSGANQFIVNDENHEAAHGIDGDMINVNWIAALTSAHTKEELEEALDGLEKEKNVVDKVSLVMGGMSKKKSNKNLWTSDIDLKFKQLCKAL